MIRSYGRVAGLFLLGFILLFADFVSKAYVYHILPYPNLPVFTNWLGVDFMITLAMNKGAAWGAFANFQVILLILRFFVIGGMLIYLFFYNQKPSFSFPLVLILTGAIGNILDFFLYGSVVDFLHFNLWGYHFPIFNFADSCITIGVAWLFVVATFSNQKKYVGI